jgi:hypothetical protein
MIMCATLRNNFPIYYNIETARENEKDIVVGSPWRMIVSPALISKTSTRLANSSARVAFPATIFWVLSASISLRRPASLSNRSFNSLNPYKLYAYSGHAVFISCKARHPKNVPAHNPTSLACLCANLLTSDHDVTKLL